MNPKNVTAGREALGEFAPKFAALNDDVLFGEIWSRSDRLSLKNRSMITVTTLIASGILDSSLEHHIKTAKENGITKMEMAELITHVAFYAGWPKAWAAFRIAMNVYGNEEVLENPLFPLGEVNPYGEYFIGTSYLEMLTTDDVPIGNVTFEPGCRNNWHIHHAKTGGGQILLVTNGQGYYQEWGKPARLLSPGDVVEIKPGVKHWHGATKDSSFTHLAIEVPGEETKNEWLEPVTDEVYHHLGEETYE